jgi:hypothetical protein
MLRWFPLRSPQAQGTSSRRCYCPSRERAMRRHELRSTFSWEGESGEHRRDSSITAVPVVMFRPHADWPEMDLTNATTVDLDRESMGRCVDASMRQRLARRHDDDYPSRISGAQPNARFGPSCNRAERRCRGWRPELIRYGMVLAVVHGTHAARGASVLDLRGDRLLTPDP